MNKHDISHLKGVPETLLIPLYARKFETERIDGLFQDPKAVEIYSQIDYDFTRFDGHSAIASVALRVRVIDDITRTFLKKLPDAVVVQLGAGLDSRFERLDNGNTRWYELDLQETMVLRQKFFDSTTRHQSITSSVLDFTWMDQVPSGTPVLFIAEGLLYYLEESDVIRLIQTLVERFPGSEIVFDTVTDLMARLSNRMGAQTKTSLVDNNSNNGSKTPPWLWGIQNGIELEKWNPSINLIKQEKYMQIYHPDFPIIGRILGSLPIIGKHFSPLIIHLALS